MNTQSKESLEYIQTRLARIKQKGQEVLSEIDQLQLEISSLKTIKEPKKEPMAKNRPGRAVTEEEKVWAKNYTVGLF